MTFCSKDKTIFVKRRIFFQASHMTWKIFQYSSIPMSFFIWNLYLSASFQIDVTYTLF